MYRDRLKAGAFIGALIGFGIIFGGAVTKGLADLYDEIQMRRRAAYYRQNRAIYKAYYEETQK